MRASLAFVFAAAAMLAACNAPAQTTKVQPERPVLVAQAHYAPRERAQALPGVVHARIESDLAFRVSGKLAKRLVDTGAEVKKGDALAQLEEADFRLQLEQAQAELASAQAGVTQAEAEAARVATLHREGWSAAADLDKIKAAADQARSARARAEKAVTLARNGLDYATLKADADGVIVSVAAEPGQVLIAGAPAMRLAHSGEREAVVAVPETQIERIKGQQASAAFWALPGVRILASLRELSPGADAATRTYQARFSLPDAPPNVQLGMSLTLSLSQGGDPVARLPLGALYDGGQGPSVWIVDRASGALKAAPVKVAGYDETSALIASGVDEGASVVVLGAHKLDAGQKVRAVESLAGL